MEYSLLCIQGNTEREILDRLEGLRKGEFCPERMDGSKKMVLCIVAKRGRDLVDKITRAAEVVRNGISSDGADGVYFEPFPLGEKSLAFVFPGQGSQYTGMLSPLFTLLPGFRQEVESVFSLWNDLDSRDMEQVIYGEGENRLQDTFYGQPAIGIVSDALCATLMKMGLQPRFLAGHSYGELTALKAGGVMDREAFLYLSRERGRLLARAGGKAPGGMLAVKASADEIRALFRVIDDVIEIANYNSPDQIVVTGENRAIALFEKMCGERSIRCVKLRTSCAFHSSLMSPVAAEWEETLHGRKMRCPENTCPALSGTVFSNYTAKPYPRHMNAVIGHLCKQVDNPVRWNTLCENMYAQGARIFLEVGPGFALTGLNDKIFAGKSHLSLACDVKSEKQLVHVMARLAGHHIPVDWELFYDSSLPRSMPAFMMPLTMAAAGRTFKPTDGDHMNNQAPSRDTARAFFEENSRVVNAFFDLQGKILEKIESTLPPEHFAEMIHDVMDKNTRVMDEFMQAQSSGMYCLTGGREAPVPELPVEVAVPESDEELLVCTAAAAVEKSGDTADETSLPGRMVEWTRREICDVTGFPEEMVTGDAEFDADLGLDSITMMQIFMGLVREFPEVERLGDKLRQARSLRTLHDIIRESPGEPPKAGPSGSGQPVRGREASTCSHTIGACGDSDLLHEILDTWDEIERWLVARLSEHTDASFATIDENTSFADDLGIDIFSYEKIIHDLVRCVPSVELAGYELLKSRTLKDLKKYIVRLIPSENTGSGGDAQNPLDVERFTLVEEACDCPDQWESPPLPGMILLAGRASSSFDYFKEVFEGGGMEVVPLLLESNRWNVVENGHRRSIGLDDISGLDRFLGHYSGEHTIPPFLYIEDNSENTFESPGFSGWSGNVEEAATAVFALAKALLSERSETEVTGDLFAVLSCGSRLPAWRASAGVVKSIGREWPGVNVRYARLAENPDGLSPRNVLSVLLDRRYPGNELVIGAEKVRYLTYRSDPLKQVDILSESPGIDGDSVLLLTGGGDGITAEIGVALAEKYRCHIVAVGRTPLPGDDFPYATVSDDALLKRMIYDDLSCGGEPVSAAEVRRRFHTVRRQQAIIRTRGRIVRCGGRFSYFSADVTREHDLKKVISTIHSHTGKINGLIHGAGMIDDKMVSSKTVASFQQVLRTKAHSIHHLYHLLKEEPLGFVVLLSSVTSFTGTVGQTDYAAANEVLNGVAEFWNSRAGYPVKSMLWAVWRETGLAGEALKLEMERAGLETIATGDGVRMCVNELTGGGKEESQVIFSPFSTLHYLNTFSGVPDEQEAELQF